MPAAGSSPRPATAGPSAATSDVPKDGKGEGLGRRMEGGAPDLLIREAGVE